jgi:hypothetical protein
MSRSRTRARRRHARTEALRSEFDQARNDPEALADLLDRMATRDTPIWPIAEAASRLRPLDESERAMVAGAVAPHLCRTLPGEARHRQVDFETLHPDEQNRRRSLI